MILPECKIIRRQLNKLYLEYVYATSKFEQGLHQNLKTVLQLKLEINILRGKLVLVDSYEAGEHCFFYDLEKEDAKYCAECENVILEGQEAFLWRKQTFCREHCCRLTQFKAGMAKKKTTSGNVVSRIVV